MSAGRFFRDYYPYMLAALLAAVAGGVFLRAFAVPGHAVIFVVVLFSGVFVFLVLREYFRRKRYYDEFCEMFDKLDKKHLIAELAEEGGFADSEILCACLRRAGKSMNDEIARHRLKMRDYIEFLEGWVHEVKTPIASALLTVENNRGGATDGVEEDILRIERYVQSALYYARGSFVEKDYLIRQVKLETLVKKALKDNSRLLIGHTMAVRMDALDIPVYTDEKWVTFILGQIISNAVKYTRREPQLHFYGEDGEAGAALYIADNGIGIPATDLPRVFEKGFTGENGRLHGKSTGMGLFLCRKLCDRLGIGIYASSAGRGTAVSLVFPKSDLYLRQ
jgi:signal transduction histidine kinase